MARLASSKTVQRAILNSVLLLSSAAMLLGLAAVSSAIFFQKFVPEQCVTAPVHLQYG